MNYPSSRNTVYCFVPGCRSNTGQVPQKLFLSVPKDPELREKWMKAAKKTNYSPKSVFRCCEDHFDMEKDVENWMRFRFVKGPLYLKKGVVPHLFNSEKKKQKDQEVKCHDHTYARVEYEDGVTKNMEIANKDGFIEATEVSSAMNAADGNQDINQELPVNEACLDSQIILGGDIETQIKKEIEHENMNIQEDINSLIKMEPCDFDIKMEFEGLNQRDYEVEDITKDLYQDHLIKEEMVIGPEIFKQEFKEVEIDYVNRKHGNTDTQANIEPSEAQEDDVITRIKKELEEKDSDEDDDDVDQFEDENVEFKKHCHIYKGKLLHVTEVITAYLEFKKKMQEKKPELRLFDDEGNHYDSTIRELLEFDCRFSCDPCKVTFNKFVEKL